MITWEKALLGIIIITFGGFCGYLFTKKYRRRKLFFMQFYTFNERFLNEISYYRRPLSQFLTQYSYKGEYATLLETYFENINEPEKFQRILFEKDALDFLKQEEKNFVFDYFTALGKGDSHSQKNCYNAQKERLILLRNEAENTCRKYGDLYIKLGILCGLLLLILMI